MAGVVRVEAGTDSEHVAAGRPRGVVRLFRPTDLGGRGEPDRADAVRVDPGEVEVVGTRVVEHARIAVAAFVKGVADRAGEDRSARARGDRDLRPGTAVGRGRLAEAGLEVTAPGAPVEPGELRRATGRRRDREAGGLPRVEARPQCADVQHRAPGLRADDL